MERQQFSIFTAAKTLAKHIKRPSHWEGLGVGFWVLTFLLTSCISTKSVPNGDQLFVGLTKITYDEDSPQPSSPINIPSPTHAQHLEATKAEVEVALATAPNGALFGSSYYRSPFSWRLWVYNRYAGKKSKFARWMMKTFGKPPVLMSQVNPALRASVAQSVLKNNGYFRSTVTYESVPMSNPKKAKIAYHVHLDSLYTLDSIAYVGFPAEPQHLIDSTAAEAALQKGQPFSVNALETERNRLSTLLRNNGYYYYAPGYVNYLADTVSTANRASLRLQLGDDLPPEVMKPWYIGDVDIRLRRSLREQLTDSLQRGHLNIHFSGEKPPMRPRVLLKNMRLLPRRLFSLERYQETAAKLNATGVFSAIDFQFTPRDRDTLDVQLNCTFDKPYDFYFETSINGRTIGRYGPEAKVGFTKRNAFHGGEKLDINLHGSYEWQRTDGERTNNYQYGADVAIEFPRIIAPFYNSDRIRRAGDGRPRRRRFYSTPTTIAKASTDIIYRPDFYKMHVASGEWTYRWQSSLQSHHELSPLTVKYQFKNSTSEALDKMLEKNAYQAASMSDQFITKLRYTYTYTSPTTQRNPIRWELSVAEAGNVVALYDVLIQGHEWNQEDKTLFKNPYAQFVRFDTDLTKTWRLSNTSQLVGHLNAGIIRSFGNTNVSNTPFTESYYVGGANSLRAFTIRSVGPGSFNSNLGYDNSKIQRQFSYLMQNGDLKLVANLEYRTRLFGNLQGALFLDAGNVWQWKELDFSDDDLDIFFDEEELSQIDATERQAATEMLSEWFSGWTPKWSTFFNQIAVNTGVGLRYDLGFLVIRLDWGVALHLPYTTSRSGWFNVDHFRDAQALHFAIGYPF